MTVKTIGLMLGLVLGFPLAAQAFEIEAPTQDFFVIASPELTGNPAGIQPWSVCLPASEDFSEPGKILADDDWIITGEVEFNGFELVSFVGFSKNPEGHLCEFHDGQIAVYRDGAFVALILDGDPDELLVGAVRPEENGIVPIVSGKTAPEATGTISYNAENDRLIISSVKAD